MVIISQLGAILNVYDAIDVSGITGAQTETVFIAELVKKEYIPVVEVGE